MSQMPALKVIIGETDMLVGDSGRVPGLIVIKSRAQVKVRVAAYLKSRYSTFDSAQPAEPASLSR